MISSRKSQYLRDIIFYLNIDKTISKKTNFSTMYTYKQIHTYTHSTLSNSNFISKLNIYKPIDIYVNKWECIVNICPSRVICVMTYADDIKRNNCSKMINYRDDGGTVSSLIKSNCCTPSVNAWLLELIYRVVI